MYGRTPPSKLKHPASSSPPKKGQQGKFPAALNSVAEGPKSVFYPVNYFLAAFDKASGKGFTDFFIGFSTFTLFLT